MLDLLLLGCNPDYFGNKSLESLISLTILNTYIKSLIEPKKLLETLNTINTIFI